MIQLGIGSVDVSVTVLNQLETQVDILQRIRQFDFVESAGLPENFPPNQQTGSRDSRAVPNDIGEVEIVTLG